MLGSVKSNSIIELAVANCFPRAEPFDPRTVWRAVDRPCPFFILYRDTDPQPPSVCGGLRLSEKEAGSGPGIYYETARRARGNAAPGTGIPTWGWCCTAFTGRPEAWKWSWAAIPLAGRRALARCLGSDETLELSPPCYSDAELDIGVFVLLFRFRSRRKDSNSLAPHPAAVEIIRLDSAVIRRRLRKGTRRAQFPGSPGVSPSAD